MVAQINPPFDDSAPCPMCSEELRGLAAILHNAHNRLDSSCLIGKLDDLLRFHEKMPVVTVPHPAVDELVKFQQELVDILRRGTSYPDNIHIRWSPETRPAVMALVPRWRAVMKEIEILSDAHFEDHRHSHGEPNILRSQQGSRGDFWGNGGGSYNHTVEVVEAGTGDIAHTACGTELRLHDHFKSRLAKDPLFYGKVWCPTCSINAPWGQFASALVSDT